MAHILVVEDDEHICFLMTKVLQSVGHTVSEASNGLKALQILKSSPFTFDLILLDINMPILNGFEFLSELKTRSFALPLPVVVTSAYQDQITAARQRGASGQLTKPFSRRQLIDIVNHFVSASPV